MRKIAIVGSAKSRADAPYEDHGWEIWALAWWDLPRVTRYFEMHEPEQWGVYTKLSEYQSRLRNMTTPVYMRSRMPEYQHSVAYPFDFVEGKLNPSQRTDWRTSSVAYMVALAIAEGAEEIGIWGVQMAADDEYAYQRPMMTWLLGLAEGRGIKLTLPPDCALLRANFEYGVGASPSEMDEGLISETLLIKRVGMYQADRKQVLTAVEKLQAKLHALDGAEQEAQALLDLVRHHKRGGYSGD